MNGNTKWILSLIALFIMVATGLGGYAVARVDSVQDCLRTEYVQKGDYMGDMTDIKHSLERLNTKMDRLSESLH